MKVVQISTYDVHGGAAKASYRLHEGLHALGLSSRMIVKHKMSQDNRVLSVTPQGLDNEVMAFFDLIQTQYISAHRTALTDTEFTLPYPGIDLGLSTEIQSADLVNLHWVAQGYQSPVTLHRLSRFGKPIVWTLHDQWPFTGGCHYTAGCEKFVHECSGCPQLSEDPYDLPKEVLKDKLHYFENVPLTVVTPSRWLAECAEKSALFRKSRIEVIPNSVETDVFRPLQKLEARKGLGLSDDVFVILFCAQIVSQKRKGLAVLISALDRCLEDPIFKDMASKEQVRLLIAGEYERDNLCSHFPVVPLGYIESNDKMREAYAASDIFVQASLEDNFPNTVLEAMSCGTPVLAFNVGGIPDIIEDGVTGWLVPSDGSFGLAEKIREIFRNRDMLPRIQAACRKRVEVNYSLGAQARRYQELYRELLTGQNSMTDSIKGGFGPHSSYQAEGSGRNSSENTLTGYVDTSLGPHFRKIFDPTLLKALKEHLGLVTREMHGLQLDRAARLEIIQKLGSKLDESEKDRSVRLDLIHTLSSELEVSEMDRAARLELIHTLTSALEVCEMDRAARLELIQRLAEELAEKKRFFNQRLVRILKRLRLIR